ncbi:hypothetical protein GUJ93_ZPchr0001g32986 [Zizania palustris]|uniref:Uncharacterized protein n=1 Tax=Zizania palustris TaxID=103762 RepID=A0A8J5RR87_ZIZPA|nr:hypothetical protein GUJ93_ZPchr0001g32986 [Zizania palustris]
MSGGGKDVRVLVGDGVLVGFVGDGLVAEVGVALAVTTVRSSRTKGDSGDGERRLERGRWCGVKQSVAGVLVGFISAQDSVVQSLALTSINRQLGDGGDGMRDGDPHYDRPHFDRKGQRESADLCSILRRPSDGGHEMRDENTMQQKESKAKGGIPANLRSIRRRLSY